MREMMEYHSELGLVIRLNLSSLHLAFIIYWGEIAIDVVSSFLPQI